MAEKRGKFFFRVWPRPFSQLIPYFNPSLYVSDSKRCNACRSTNMRAVLCNEIVHTGRRFQVNFLARGGHNLTLRINTQLFRHGRLHCISNTIRVLKRRDIRATLTSGRVLCKCLIKDLANAARPASTSTFCGVRVNKFMSRHRCKCLYIHVARWEIHRIPTIVHLNLRIFSLYYEELICNTVRSLWFHLFASLNIAHAHMF